MSDEPELRSGPPWAMEEMILAEPALPDPIVHDPAVAEAAGLVRAAAAAGAPVVLAGCGTSEHAAMAGAALRNADAHGAKPVLITASPGNAPEGPLVIATPLRDTSWCHTVGYLSPLLAFLGMAGGAPGPARALIEATLARRAALGEAARAVAGCERLVVVGGGVDEITARELALKIEEATHVPVAPLGQEKVLHGHLPAADERTGLVLLRFDGRQAAARDARGENALAAARVLGMPSVTLRAQGGDLTPVAAALVEGALALQLFTLELTHARGTNPDLIRREEPRYREAAEAAGAG